MKKMGICLLCLLLLSGCQTGNNKKVKEVKKDAIIRGYFNEDGYIKVKKDKKYGFMDKDKHIKIPCEYDLLIHEDDVYYAEKNGKYGILNKQNQKVLPIAYERILYAEDTQYFFACKDKTTTVFDKHGDKIKVINAALAKQAFQAKMVWLEKDGKRAVFDTKGNQKTKFIYDNTKKFPEIQAYDKHFYTICYQAGKAGIVDEQGKENCAFVYDELRPLTYGSVEEKKFSGYYQAVRDGKSGIIDIHGNIIADFIYDKREAADEGGYLNNFYYVNDIGFIVVKDGHYGVLSLQGKSLIPCIAVAGHGQMLTGIVSDENGFCVKKKNTTAYYTKEGKQYLEVQGDGDGFMNGYAIVSGKEEQRIINEKGEVILRGSKDDKLTRAGSLIQHCKQAVCTLYDTKGKKVLQGEEAETFNYLEGKPHAVVVKEKIASQGLHTTSTIYDLQGKQLAQFEGISNGPTYGILFGNHFAFFSRQGYGKTGKMGLVSMDGKHEIKPRYYLIGEEDDYYIGYYADGSGELIEKESLNIVLKTDKEISFV